MAQARLRTLIPEDRLLRRVRELGRRIRRDHGGREIVLVGILKGSFVFMADLMRAVGPPVLCDFLRVSSYGSGTLSDGKVKLGFDLSRPILGKAVVVVEDIVDTGWTVAKVLRLLRGRNPASLKLASLLHKPLRTRVAVPIDYLGFPIPDVFVVGYGLDHDERHRELPRIAVLSPEKAR